MASASEDCFLGVDVGTGSARACVVDSGGEILAVSSKDIKLWRDGPDIYEQSTDDIWDAICQVTRNVMRDSGKSPKVIRGIGFDATCSLAVLDNNDRSISVSGPHFDDQKRNIILWADHRAHTQTDRINNTGASLLKFVGETMSIEMEMPKILWLKENAPKENFDKMKFYDLADCLTHLATGDEARSNCSLVCKLGFVPPGVDGSTEGWNRDFLATIGLGDLCENNFARLGGTPKSGARVLHAGQVVGGLSQQAAEQLGLEAGTPVGSGVIDAYAGWIGTVGAKIDPEYGLDAGHGEHGLQVASHRIAAVAGTSTCHLVAADHPIFVPGVWGPYKNVLTPDYWLAEGGQSATGALLHYVLTSHAAIDTAREKAKSAGVGVFEFLNNRLREIQHQTGAPSVSYLVRHTFLYPDFHGNRSPIADPNMRGTIVGLGMDADVDALATHYYTAMEAIGQQTRHIIDSLNARGHKITQIFMSGGQCKNDLLMHLIASCTKLPIVMPKYIDAAVVLGSAFLGAVAASGGKEDLWGVMTRLSKVGDVVFPTQEPHEQRLLETKYKIFLDMADSQRKYRRAVDDANPEYAPTSTDLEA